MLSSNNCIKKIKLYLLELQNRLCECLEKEDGKIQFVEDKWGHPTGGYGLTRTIKNGAVIEKAGVNFSHVYGVELPQAATLKRPDLINGSFKALGLSTVIHPFNPYVPTAHMNVRYIEVTKEDCAINWWFGGGFDLTPYYGFLEDCTYWHEMALEACSPFGADVYPRYKKWCDEYFYLKHRKEPRGIGGLFFDDLNEWGFDRSFDFMKSVGDHFIKAYHPILSKRKDHAFTERERHFQAYRRGRYVEFNLLYDRGTLFGLQSNGRTESILMSLPPQAIWEYNGSPQAETDESKLYNEFLMVRDWVGKC